MGIVFTQSGYLQELCSNANPQSSEEKKIVVTLSEASKNVKSLMVERDHLNLLEKLAGKPGKKQPGGKQGGKKSQTVGKNSNSGSKTGKTLAEVIRSLDHTNDEHWIQSGLPKIDAVVEMFGQDVTRAEISEAVPDFDREAAAKASK